MSTLLVLADARKRGIPLPADDAVAQDILDETEAELARYLGGPLTGSRTETFYVGNTSFGKLSLQRYTDAVTVTDNGQAVDAAHFRLIDRGSAIARHYTAPSWWWTGQYVAVTYEPNDELEVTAVAYRLLALSATPATAVGALKREQIGDYEYELGDAAATPQAASASRKALASSVLPKRDALYNLRSTRQDYPDPFRRTEINAAEVPL